MSLHGLLSVTMGVPNVDETAAYYADFGLSTPAGSSGSCTRRPGAWSNCGSASTTRTT